MQPLRLMAFLGIALCGLAAAGAAHGQADADHLVEAARAAVKQAWEQEVQPFSESALTRIEIHAVQSRNRLAPGVHLVHAFAETSWWKHSEHYLLLMRSAEAGAEVLYRYRGGAGGKGLTYRLVDVGARGSPGGGQTGRSPAGGQTGHYALRISDHGFEDDDVTGTWTILVLYLPASDRFAEVFRELTTYRPATPHGYASELGFRQAEGPMQEITVRTELLKDLKVVDRVESIFSWQESAYQGIMPLPEAWRAELPSRIRLQAPATPSAGAPEN